MAPHTGVAAGSPAGPSAYFRDAAGRELLLEVHDHGGGHPFAGLLGGASGPRGPDQQLPALQNATGGPDCVGFVEATSTGYAILLAGYSTMLGFFIFQLAQNFVAPPGTSWLDPRRRIAEVEGIKTTP